MIGGRTRSFGRCGAPSSLGHTRASHSCQHDSRASHHRSSFVVVVARCACARGYVCARGGGLDRRPRARGAAICDRWSGSLVRSLWRALVTRSRARVTPRCDDSRASHHRSSFVVVVARCACARRGYVCARGGGFDRRPRARGAAIGDRWSGLLVRSLWRALVTRSRARVTPRCDDSRASHHRSSFVVVVARCACARRGYVCARGGGFDRRPRARGAAIGDRWSGLLVRSLWRALVTRSRARVTPRCDDSRASHHRSSFVVVVARCACARRGYV